MLKKLFWEIVARNRKMQHDLIILDDIFPHMLSPFRITEFNAILDRFASSAAYSSGKKFKIFGRTSSFQDIYREYAALYPQHSQRAFPHRNWKGISASLCYLVFLNNAHYFLDFLTALKIPFVLELYPGGGFRLHEKDSDLKLRRVTSSPLFRKAITTQKVTSDYLIDSGFCTPDQVEFVFGGVFPAERLTEATGRIDRKFFPRDKDSFDICFVAHKYMAMGRDKGYDVFVEAARLIAGANPKARFHVVGPFCPEDMDVSMFKDRLTFYGSRTTDFFPSFYAGMDVILSPNAPNILAPGAFDGFPTGACIEAALCGTAIFACDELGLNPFKDRDELVIISRDPAEIATVVMRYMEDPSELYRVAGNGQKSFSRVFSVESQMAPRFRVLETLLDQ